MRYVAKVKNSKKLDQLTEIMIITFFFMITVSGSLFFNEYGITKVFEYLAYGIFITCISRYAIRKRIKPTLISITVIALFLIGIWVQDLSIQRRIVLSFTMYVIWISIFKTKGIALDAKLLRKVSYAILFALIISLILCVIAGLPLSDAVYDSASLLKMGFNGGIKHKNYYAADLISVIMGIYYSNKNGIMKKMDIVLLFVLHILLFASGSRGAMLILLSFYVIIFVDKIISMIIRNQRKAFTMIVCIFGTMMFIVAYKLIALNSSTYLYRIRGFLNYIDYFKQDNFHMIFGSAEMFYDKEIEYVYAVRSVIGWDGTLEFAWINVLIKNGILGVIGFLMVFFRYMHLLFKNKKMDTFYIAVITMLLVSSLVETYMQTIHSIFGIYCYFVLSGIASCKKSYVQNAYNYNMTVK